MTVGVREHTCVAPRLLPGLGDDLGAGLVRALDQLLYTCLAPGTKAEDALALSAPRDLSRSRR
jgi:hypothetical protein